MPHLNQWRTSITEIADSSIAYRGRAIDDLLDHEDLTDVLWLLLFESMPEPEQSDALRRSLVAALDHGPTAPAAVAARVTASTRGPSPMAIATGLIAFAGPAHGGAAEGAARLLVDIVEGGGDEAAATRVARAVLDAGERVPGFGHPYHTHDPRVPGLLRGTALDQRHRAAARTLESVLPDVSGKPLRMNADAAVAGLLLDAGLEIPDVTLITALGRAFGLAAHAREERVHEKPFRAPALDSVVYEGVSAHVSTA